MQRRFDCAAIRQLVGDTLRKGASIIQRADGVPDHALESWLTTCHRKLSFGELVPKEVEDVPQRAGFRAVHFREHAARAGDCGELLVLHVEELGKPSASRGKLTGFELFVSALRALPVFVSHFLLTFGQSEWSLGRVGDGSPYRRVFDPPRWVLQEIASADRDCERQMAVALIIARNS